MHGQSAFFAILGGQLVSSVGSAMTRIGLVIWTLAETGDATAYSLLLLAAFLPLGLAGVFAGPMVDRWNRRKVMIAANAVASLFKASDAGKRGADADCSQDDQPDGGVHEAHAAGPEDAQEAAATEQK